MVQKIALFNPRVGVGTTTTTLNLGWMLASKGKRVILVDVDPQCDLTERVLDLTLGTNDNTNSNIKTGLAPAFEAQPKAIEAVDCMPIPGQEGLFLLPSSLELSEYEVPLGNAQNFVPQLKSLPGAISYLLEKTANKFNAEYLLIDMSPNLSSLNQNLLTTSDFFLFSTLNDRSSAIEIDLLSRVLPKWYSWAKLGSSRPMWRNAIYPFPEIKLYFLGTLLQNFRSIHGKTPEKERDFRIESQISEVLVSSLRQNDMLLSEIVYHNEGIDEFILERVPNFSDLMRISDRYGTLVYNLTSEQLSQPGLVVKTLQQEQEKFREIFSSLADKIIGIASPYAVSA